MEVVMKNSRVSLIATIFLCFLFVNTYTFAAIIQVPGDQPTIQAGIDAAKKGDVVLVEDGVYRGDGNVNIDFMGKEITVRSLNGAENTIIDCQELPETRGFVFQNHETKTSRVDGFTIQNGTHDLGGGIYCYESSPTISNCVIKKNRAVAKQYHNQGGGGIYGYNSEPIIRGCTITGNHAESVNGGGVYFEGEEIRDETILLETPIQPSLMECSIFNNSGSGVFIYGFVNPLINACDVSYNSGRGIVYNGFVRGVNAITDCRITNNAGGVECSEYSRLKMTNSLIERNTARYGGGIHCSPSSAIDISECVIVHNVAEESGGGIDITSKHAESNVSYCTITLNIAHKKGGGVSAHLEGGSFTLTDSIVWGNRTDGTFPEFSAIGGRIAIQSSDIKGGLDDIGRQPDAKWFIYVDNIDADPLFVDVKNGDYSLKPQSPAAKMGAQSPVRGTYDVSPAGKKLVKWAALKRK